MPLLGFSGFPVEQKITPNVKNDIHSEHLITHRNNIIHTVTHQWFFFTFNEDFSEIKD